MWEGRPQGELSFVPPETLPLKGLHEVNRELILRATKSGGSETATVDHDGTIIESHKQAATIAYEGFFRWHKAEGEKRKLRQAVQNYFSPAVLEAILENPALLNLTGEKKEVTILFSDIRSFTTISEQIEPEALTEMLHEYFTEMTEEIFVACFFST